ncbi:MAG: hypothetical protein WBM32_08890, partial [Crocosphaera sp.]
GQPPSTEVVEEADKPAPLKAITADDPQIPLDQLTVLLKPLTQEQLQAEADQGKRIKNVGKTEL